MFETGKDTDENNFIYTSYLFEWYKEALAEGKHLTFSSNFPVQVALKEATLNLDRGLHDLGNAVYFVITGVGEQNDRSIKIDGHLPIDSVCWPILEEMLSGKKQPNLRKIEARINKQWQSIKERERMRDKTKFLWDAADAILKVKAQEVSAGIKNDEGNIDFYFPANLARDDYPPSPEVFWVYNEKDSLVDMVFGRGDLLLHGGFIDKISRVKFNMEGAVLGEGMAGLIEVLQNKNFLSVYDGITGGWYLEVY